MKTGIIGAGKVGFTLGKFFARTGIQVTGYYSRHREAAEEAAEFTDTKVYDSIADIVKDSDAVFITVPDGAITSVYNELKQCGIKNKTICHCSGSMSADEAFPGIKKAGASAYAIHPLFPISSRLNSWRELADAFFCIEGTGDHLQQWKGLLEKCGLKVQIIDSGSKGKYHAACTFACNLMCALVQKSLELLEECGFTEETARQALAPLMRGNLEHIIESGPVSALTGPLERGDANTLKKHMEVLESGNDMDLYVAASAKLLSVAHRKNPSRNYSEVAAILKEGANRK